MFRLLFMIYYNNIDKKLLYFVLGMYDCAQHEAGFF